MHIDEATHPVDLILNQILPALHMPNRPVSLLCSSRKYDDSIIDRNQQLKLYQDQPEKLIPLAEVEFQIRTHDVTIHVLSSFARAPQVREIVLNCSSQTKIRLVFDKDQTDQLEIISPQKIETTVFEKPNKLLLEWRAFLDYYHTGNSSNALATVQDMADDILITELLDEIPLNQEIRLKNFDLQVR